MTNLEKIMREKGLTPSELSKRMGYKNTGSIYTLLKGERSLYLSNFKTVYRLANILGVEMIDLIDDSDLQSDSPLYKFKNFVKDIKDKYSNSKTFEIDDSMIVINISEKDEDNIELAISELGLNSDTYSSFYAVLKNGGVTFMDMVKDKVISSRDFYFRLRNILEKIKEVS